MFNLRLQEMGNSCPPPPPKCPRVVPQSLPRRPGRVRLKISMGSIQRRCVCPPMDLLHPSIMLSLRAEAPGQMDLSQIDSDGFAAPRVPRAFPPLAPLGPIELPPRDSFGLTRPVAPVGRNYARDGGIPRPVERKTATVVPPLLLTSACIERIGEMVWACVDPIPVPEPPRQTVVPAASHSSSSMDLVKGAITDFPREQGFPALLAAACDLPRVCDKGCAGQSAMKPVRMSAPLPYFAAHCKTGSVREGCGRKGVCTSLSGVRAIFDDAPSLDFATRIQEAVDDVPHFVYQWPVPPAIPPYVPAISEPVAIAWAHAGVAAAGGERPEVMAGTDRAASEALQVLDAEFPGSGSCVSAVLTPETIKQKSVGYPRFDVLFAGKKTVRPNSAGNCGQSFPPDQGALDLKDVPVWRDGLDMQPPSPGPVWRDSDESLEELRDSFRRPGPRKAPPKEGTPDDRFSSTETILKARQKPDKADFSRSRSPSPLSSILRRKRAQCFAKLSGGTNKRNSKPKPSPAVPGKREGTTSNSATTGVSRRKQRMTGKAVWKDSATAATRKVLFDPARFLELVSDVEAAPSKNSGLASRKRNKHGVSGRAQIGVLEAAPLAPPPPQDNSPETNQHWRHITHPLRAWKKNGQGARGVTSTYREISGLNAVKESPGAYFGLTRSRSSHNNRNSEFLPAALSPPAASFPESIADGTSSPLPRVFTARGTQPPGKNARAGQRRRRQRFSASRYLRYNGFHVGSRTPPRAPAFEPRGGPTSDHRTAPNTEDQVSSHR